MINKKDGKQTLKRGAPVDQDGAHNFGEHGSRSPKRTDTPGIDGNLVGNVNSQKMRAVRVEPYIHTRRHITAVNPL